MPTSSIAISQGITRHLLAYHYRSLAAVPLTSFVLPRIAWKHAKILNASGLQVPADKYGFADNASEFVTLYGLCAGYSNISQVLNDDTLPADQVDLVKPYLSSTARSDLQSLTNAVTQCLSDTCTKAVDSSNCTAKCSPAQLLLNSTTPNLAGAQACFQELCRSSSGLPFGNQDVMGPGVGHSPIRAVSFIAYSLD